MKAFDKGLNNQTKTAQIEGSLQMLILLGRNS